jgi:ComF family protein
MRLLDVLVPPACVACSGWAGRAEPLCAGCRARVEWLGPDAVDGVWAPVAYAGPARAVVGAVKFRGGWRAVETMAAAVVAGAPCGWLAADAVLVPVPLHPARMRSRGFNQAELLAAAIGRRAGVPVLTALARGGPKATQMGLGRGERLRRMEDAVSVAAGARVPLRVVLVDDVVTTGATLAACRAALLAAGALEVRAVAYARTPGR